MWSQGVPRVSREGMGLVTLDVCGAARVIASQHVGVGPVFVTLGLEGVVGGRLFLVLWEVGVHRMIRHCQLKNCSH